MAEAPGAETTRALSVDDNVHALCTSRR